MSWDEEPTELEPLFNKARGSATRVEASLVHGRQYDVPSEIDAILRRITEGDPISYELMVQMVGSESGFKNVTSPTGAMGIAQFVESTLLEAAYKHKHHLPREYQNIVNTGIEKYNSAKPGEPPWYSYRISGDPAQVHRLALDPEPALILMREYIRETAERGNDLYREQLSGRIGWIEKNPDKYPLDGATRKIPSMTNAERLDILKENLNQPLTAADVKTMYMLGSKPGADLVLAHADPTTHAEGPIGYVPQNRTWVVTANKPVFYKDNDTPKNVVEYFDHVESLVGNAPLAENLDRPERHFADARPVEPPSLGQ